MWESPEGLWRRLKLGREEYVQRLITTMIVGGIPPAWNAPSSVSEQGSRFVRLLDDLAHNQGARGLTWTEPDSFVDEYLLPKLEGDAQNGWPDWAVVWPDRVWIIELKTEAASHRDDQLPYYLRLAAAAHPSSRVDLTYITGPLVKESPDLLVGQRYSHLTWDQVLPLVVAVWGADDRAEVAAYVSMVTTLIENLTFLRPAEQRAVVLGQATDSASSTGTHRTARSPGGVAQDPGRATVAQSTEGDDLLSLAQRTAADGRQRGVGALDPTHLEHLRTTALARIGSLPPDDRTRFVLPWVWSAPRTDGGAITSQGEEFGYELRFSRYTRMQVKP